jgi:hypothetical protein
LRQPIFVDRFYKRLVGRYGPSEATSKLVERLQKNRNKMFTFLEFDGVPWNNNNAEHAVKAFVSLRRVIEGPPPSRLRSTAASPSCSGYALSQRSRC